MQKLSFNREWRFHLGDWLWSRWVEPDDSAWRVLDLPHDWSIELPRDPANPSGNLGGYFPMGCGWYRKSFDAPEDWRGKKVAIEFEGVYMNAEVWLNDQFLGRHPYGYTSFCYDLTPYLKLDAPNILKVAVDNAAQMSSRWYSGSGIYRPVWLLVGEPVHVAHWGVAVTTPQVSADSATVRAVVTVQNEGEAAQSVVLCARVLDANGKTVSSTEARAAILPGSQHEYTLELPVATPRLWSPDAPYLYRLETEVVVSGQIVDRETTTFGIRTLSFSAEKGFLLNGQSLKLKGGCVHHDNGVLGATSHWRAEERKVELHKASGYNAIRCAHNPPAPAFLNACDRLGMLVIDEAFDCWRIGKTPYDYHVAFEDWWPRDIESMVQRDRNHPSVIFWGIGNEIIERTRPDGFRLARLLADHVRKLDATRPVTAAVCGPWGDKWAWPQADEFFAPLDVGGYNYEWQQYHGDHERCPQRVMMGTESFPIEAFANWQSVLENPYVIGDFVWTSLDYLGESGIGRVHFDKEKDLGAYPWHQANCGDLDLCGFKRAQSYYRDMLWGGGERLYIAVHHPAPEGKTAQITRWGWPEVSARWTWPGHEGQTFKAEIYAACEEVELFLNGRSLGRKLSGRAEKHIAAFELPYAPGELKAVGYVGGRAVAESRIATACEAARIRLTADRNPITAVEGDLCYVTAEIVDADGRVHPCADATLYFTVKGAGRIAAVGSADPTSTELYRGHQRTAHRGRCLVVVQPSGAGEITLRAQADGLDGDEIAIRAS